MSNKIKFAGVKNIIFDLGGVILNIDYKLTANTFQKLGINNYNDLYTQFNQVDIFDKLEKGEITPAFFYNEIRRMSNLNINDEQITDAWNAMLLDFPVKRLELLQNLKNDYNIYLCSNTNEIHLANYNKTLKQTFGIENLGDIFIKEYYSHKVGMRKPNSDIFQLIIDENNLTPKETLFIDDSPQHIEGAKKVGLIAYHLIDGEDILELF